MLARFALVAAVSWSAVAVADEPKPPDFIKPYPGQQAYGTPKVKDFDEVYVLAGKVKSEPPSEGWKKLEGKVSQYHWDIPEGRSTLESSRTSSRR